MTKKAKAGIAFTLALVLLALRAVGPSLATAEVRLLQLGSTTTVTTETAEGVLFDDKAWESGQPLDPSCGTHVSCFVSHPSVSATTTIEAKPGSTRKTADYNVKHHVATADGTNLFDAADKVTLVRHSSIPVDEPLDSLESQSPLPGFTHHTTEQIRDGLQYTFPFATEFRSYRYFDIYSATTTPIDFHDKETLRGHTVYRFNQKIAPVQLQIGGIKGAANQFYDPQEITEQGLAAASTVVMNQYYSMTRTLWVEPKTGTIIDSVEIPHIFLARDAVEAARVQPDSPRTLFRATLRWDEDTRAHMWQQADEHLNLLHWVSVSLLLATAASAGLIVLGIYFLRRQD
ncbi:DUF3068 domain-containing protein [Corynebacterium sp. H130]|uniref:DUF3068 domain-containing protein n=1 Tax=Corynebacterium sp. H130 TaxID=3133444 RepID=UPI00309E0A67